MGCSLQGAHSRRAAVVGCVFQRTPYLHPYFKAHGGQRDACHALLPAFVEKTRPDKYCLYYEFTAHEDEIFCREARPIQPRSADFPNFLSDSIDQRQSWP